MGNSSAVVGRPAPTSSSVRPRWRSRSLGNALVVTLVISGITLLVLANWRGPSPASQPGGLVALAVVAAGFFAGGAVAGRHRRQVSGAVMQGLALAALSCGTIVLAGIFRLVLLGKGIAGGTVGWLALGLVLATLLTVLGAVSGRARARARAARRARPPARTP